MPIEIQDKSLDDLQQDTGDQAQLLIIEVPESELAENPIIEVQATSAAEVNFLIFSDFFLNSVAHFRSLYRFHQPCLLLFKIHRPASSPMM
jgi:hypothetical protein